MLWSSGMRGAIIPKGRVITYKRKGLVLAIHLCKYISPDLERFWKLESGMNLECGERARFMIASIL